jgi:hypothetical protein
MKLKDFSLDMRDRIPKVDFADIRLLWHSAYWDGPIDGMLRYDGRELWFHTVAEPDTREVFRIMVMLELTPEQIREETDWHDLFRRKVGHHTDYDATGKLRLGQTHPKESHHEFYEPYRSRQPRDLSNNEIIAWFEY